MKKYSDLIEKLQSLKNYNIEDYVNNIHEIYKNFKYEETVCINY